MRRIHVLMTLLLTMLLSVSVMGQESQSDIELWSYIQRQSPQWYQSYLIENGIVDAAEWTQPLESAFLKLANNSGEKGFNISYSIAARDDFNAMCFPGGQFVVHAGTLDILDAMISSAEGSAIDQISVDRLRLLREVFIAPILAHELGHYYNRHSFQAMKAQWNLAEMNRIDNDLSELRFSQDNEFEADATGFLLLRMAGYNPSSMLMILELLNTMRQESLDGATDTSLNEYFVTHPSPHRRQAALEKDPEGMNRWAASLEQAFSDIQLGINLGEAAKTLDAGLVRVPGNLHLEKAKAIALHKRWLSTTSLAQQKLKGQIEMPIFRDEMVFSEAGTRAAKKTIPGDQRKYFEAKKAYSRIYRKTSDPGFYSNYALLLAYSPDSSTEQIAQELAYLSVETSPTISNLSNFGVVMYLTGDTQNSLDIFVELAGIVSADFDYSINAAQRDASIAQAIASMYQHMERVQSIDRGFIQPDFVPLLNLALLLSEEGETDGARCVAETYIEEYESNSAWAAYLANETGLDIPESTRQVFLPVKGVKILDSIPILVEKWGSATDITSMADGSELWYFAEEQAKVSIQSGLVSQIELYSPDSPRVANRFGIGSNRQEIEMVLGSPDRMVNMFTVYEGDQNTAVAYVNSIAEIIVLFP